MNTYRCIHLADLHLGFTGNTSLLADSTKDGAKPYEIGRYLREVDIERAVRWVAHAILTANNPPVDVVIIAGDLFHKKAPFPRAMETAAAFVSYLIQSGIEVIIVEGNHEMPTSAHAGNPLAYLRYIGAHVFNTATSRLLYESHHWRPNSRLQSKQGLALHALPYRALYERCLSGIHPLPEHINILVTHGRVEGTYDKNTLGDMVATIPAALLRQSWDYIALGDWHMHRYQPLADVPAYYAGSLEALHFGEACPFPAQHKHPYALHGMLDVRLIPGKPAQVGSIPSPCARPVLRLDPIDAQELDAQTIIGLIEQRLTAPLPPHALCRLDVRDYHPLIWDELDHEQIDAWRKRVRLCEIRWYPKPVATPEEENQMMASCSLEDQWTSFLSHYIDKETERSWYIRQGTAVLDAARARLLADDAKGGNE